MNNEEAIKATREKVEVMEAWCEGNEIQYGTDGIRWNNFSGPNNGPAWNWDGFVYRIKPTPKTVPFTFEDLPDGPFWVRKNLWVSSYLVMCIQPDAGFGFMDNNGFRFIEFEKATEFKWSENPDGPWNPFTKEVSE